MPYQTKEDEQRMWDFIWGMTEMYVEASGDKRDYNIITMEAMNRKAKADGRPTWNPGSKGPFPGDAKHARDCYLPHLCDGSCAPGLASLIG